MDKYQERYIAHQARKKQMLSGVYTPNNKYTKKEKKAFEKILKNRKSRRVFKNEEIDLTELLELINHRPSSCDRKAVDIKVIESRDGKDLLSGLLVGGVGWINRANKILLCIAKTEAYKSPAEKGIMEYLDTGVLVQNVYLVCEVLGIGVCFVNPNIREDNLEFFYKRFIPDGYKFTGALILGK